MSTVSVAGDDPRMARVALTWLTEPGAQAVWHLVQAHGPVRALDLLVRGEIEDEKLRGAVAARLRAGDPRRIAAAAAVRARRLGARVAVPEDVDWPPRLADLTKLHLPGDRSVDRETAPPLCLWVRGDWPLAEAFQDSVAIVGSRAATPYGTHVAGGLAYGLAEREWTVVSGGAYGIDAAAHRGALAAGGLTVAVLACGVDRPYPMGNAALFDRVVETGLLISEWPPGAEPHRHRFIIRNRVIAAVTAGTVLVEAAARSGATSTFRRAAALNRRAMVVPGPVTSAMSVGCHEALREVEDARLVTGAAHVLEEVGRIGADLAPRPQAPSRPRDDLDDDAARLLEAMPKRRAILPEEIAARAGVDLRTALRKLGMLAALGFLVRSEHGAYALARDDRPGHAGRPDGQAKEGG